MIKLFTFKEKLMRLYSNKAAMCHALKRFKDEFEAIDPVFYKYAKYQYDIKFVTNTMWASEYKNSGFRVEIKYNKEYFKYKNYLNEFKIQRFERFCDLDDYYFENIYRWDRYKTIAELHKAIEADIRKFDRYISEFESQIKVYEKYLDAGFIFTDIIDSARDRNPSVLLSIETFDKYFNMFPENADKENYKKYILKEFKEQQDGMPVNYASNAWVTTYEYWATNHVDLEKMEADEAVKNEKYKELIDEINR